MTRFARVGMTRYLREVILRRRSDLCTKSSDNFPAITADGLLQEAPLNRPSFHSWLNFSLLLGKLEEAMSALAF